MAFTTCHNTQVTELDGGRQNSPQDDMTYVRCSGRSENEERFEEIAINTPTEGRLGHSQIQAHEMDVLL